MISFNVNTDKGKLKITAPSSWEELTVKQLILIKSVDSDDLIQLFSIVTGIEFDRLNNSKDAKLEAHLYQTIEFLLESPEWEKIKAPRRYNLGGKLYEVPDISKATLGQNVMLSNTIANSKDFIGLLPKVIAIYFQPVIDGSFNRHRIPEVEELVLNSAALDAYGVGSFFLSNPKNSTRITALGSHLFSPTRWRRL